MSEANVSIEEQVKSLASPDPVARQTARQRLIETGIPAVGPVVELLKHPQPHVRWEACKVLGGIGDPSAGPALVEAMAERDQDVRWVAGEALIAMGRKGLEPLLSALSDSKRVAALQASAHHVVHDLAKGPSGEALQPLLEALSGADPELSVPVAAEAALEKLRTDSARPR